MSIKNRKCKECGKPCWGRRCMDCFCKNKRSQLSRRTSKARYLKNHPITAEQKEKNKEYQRTYRNKKNGKSNKDSKET